MKYKIQNKGNQLTRMIQYGLVAICLFILPAIVSAQPTPPTGSGGTGGGIPDSPNPLSVPFDSHLAVLLIAAGVALAVVVITRMQKGKVTVG